MKSLLPLALANGAAIVAAIADGAAQSIPGFNDFNFTSLTSIGFAVWYGVYVTRVAIPKIVEKHDAQILRKEEQHGAQLKEQRTDFLQSLRDMKGLGQK